MSLLLAANSVQNIWFPYLKFLECSLLGLPTTGRFFLSSGVFVPPEKFFFCFVCSKEIRSASRASPKSGQNLHCMLNG